MPEEEGIYEIMPYKEIVNLKKQIDELRAKSQDTGSTELLNSMNNLTKNMDNMLQLFKSAAEQMKLEEKEERDLVKSIGPLMDKVDSIIEQNKTIAEGMVAIADMVREFIQKAEEKEKQSIETKTTMVTETMEIPARPMPPYRPVPPPALKPSPSSPATIFPELPEFNVGEQGIPPPPPMPPEFPTLPEEPKKRGLFGRFKT